MATNGTYTLIWLDEEGPDGRTQGLTLEEAFHQLMVACDPAYRFQRCGGRMTLLTNGEPYRVRSDNPNDDAARHEIRLAGIGHCWGEQRVECEG